MMVEQRTIDLSAIKDPVAVAIIKLLLEENHVLRERVRLLEEEVARLKKNSSTSSKPPSSDITKPESEQRQPGKRKIGGQAQHPGKTRMLLPPEEVDTFKDLKLEESSCTNCGSVFTGTEEQEILIQQTFELREKPIEVTEYQRSGCRCNNCGAATYAALPEGVIEDQLCGPRLQALLSYMKGGHGASYTDLQEFCQDVLGIPVSRSTICAIMKRVSHALEVPYEELGGHIREEKAVNIDESGWKDSGSRYWIWVFCTKLVAFFSIQKSRGCIVLKTILGEAFAGSITSDFYSASENQQFCLAHLIRDIKFLTTLPAVETKVFGEKILEYFKKLFELWHERDKIPKEQFLKRCEQLQRKLFTFLTDSNFEKGEAFTMKKRLIRTWDSLFRFVKEPDLYQPTNNLAELTIRAVIRIRNNTQGSRSDWVRMWNSRIFSVLSTCKKQKRSAFHFILGCINAQKFNGIYPSLLPT